MFFETQFYKEFQIIMLDIFILDINFKKVVKITFCNTSKFYPKFLGFYGLSLILESNLSSPWISLSPPHYGLPNYYIVIQLQ
jgi:hypothetical protein